MSSLTPTSAMDDEIDTFICVQQLLWPFTSGLTVKHKIQHSASLADAFGEKPQSRIPQEETPKRPRSKEKATCPHTTSSYLAETMLVLRSVELRSCPNLVA